MPNNDFEDEEPTKPIVEQSAEELEWQRVIRERATTRNLRKPAAQQLQWIEVIK